MFQRLGGIVESDLGPPLDKGTPPSGLLTEGLLKCEEKIPEKVTAPMEPLLGGIVEGDSGPPVDKPIIPPTISVDLPKCEGKIPEKITEPVEPLLEGIV